MGGGGPSGLSFRVLVMGHLAKNSEIRRAIFFERRGAPHFFRSAAARCTA
jgi:hypothetical protein